MRNMYVPRFSLHYVSQRIVESCPDVGVGVAFFLEWGLGRLPLAGAGHRWAVLVLVSCVGYLSLAGLVLLGRTDPHTCCGVVEYVWRSIHE